MSLPLENILKASGDNANNRKVIAALSRTMPEREYRAVLLWLSTFYGFQQNWLLDSSRYSALVKCRQIGGSHTYAAAAVLWGLLGEDTSIVSIGERESTEVLEKVTKHAEGLAALGSRWARATSKSVTKLRLATGASIAALPASSGGRGKSGNMLLDESAYFEHEKKVWDGAAATTMHGYRLRIISTPNGVGNLFHGVITNGPSWGYRIHRVTLEQARAEGMFPDEAACKAMIASLTQGDPRLYDQLFACSFLDGDQQYIPTVYINRCTSEDLASTEGEYYAGLDIARTADLTVLIVVRVVKGVRHVVYVESMKRTDGDELDAMVARAFRHFKLKRLCIDATGIGRFPAEAMKKKHSERVEVRNPRWRPRVELVFFSPNSKELLATGMHSAFQHATVRIPADDVALGGPVVFDEGVHGNVHGAAKALRDDVSAIRRIVTANNNIKYDAPHTSAGHADHAWALALALYACSTPNPMIEAIKKV